MTLNISKEEPKSKTHSQDFIPSFIRKTYDLLDEGRFPHFIDWSSDGTALVIKKPSEFSQKVLPVYFKHNNFTSFVRQLNMYDFHKKRTQTLDHVYVHDLFQKGKRHLLQDIKRKTHENTVEKNQKAAEAKETSTSEQDLSTLANENQFFKRLYNEAMNRLSTLENQAKELSAQNLSLWNQIHKNDRETSKPLFNPFEAQHSELTLEQLPMTMGKMSLNLNPEYKSSVQVSSKLFTPVPYEGSDESTGTTISESHDSPAFQSENESEEMFTFPMSQKTGVHSQYLHFPLPQGQSLGISRQEMSVGKMLESWNFGLEGDDMLCFADQKVDRPSGNVQSVFQEKSVLGKRPFHSEELAGEGLEPIMKRHELSVFHKKAGMSAGVEDKQFVEAMFYGNTPAIRGYEVSNGIDLIDF